MWKVSCKNKLVSICVYWHFLLGMCGRKRFRDLGTKSNLQIVLSAESTDLVLKHLNPHAVAAGVLLYLKELNGSLLTSSLHDAFIAAAGPCCICNFAFNEYACTILVVQIDTVTFSLE
jgi:hypothetical protein